MQEAVAAPQLGGIVLQLRFILLFTFGCELLGALLLLPVFVRDYGWCEGGWLALFHAVVGLALLLAFGKKPLALLPYTIPILRSSTPSATSYRYWFLILSSFVGRKLSVCFSLMLKKFCI